MSITIKRAFACAIVTISLVLSLPASARSQTNIQQEANYSQAELAQMLAPIALYPDSLLTHILIASTYPLEVVQANRWLEQHSQLDPSLAVELAEQQGWDPSVVALVAFGSVLQTLNDDLVWTQNLGEAFLQDEGAVLDSIQELRLQAERANSLQQMQNVRVTKVNRQIIIEPVHTEIIYVPYYDTRVVYGNWRWRNYPPVYWDRRPYFSVSLSNQFYWTPGIHINFNYFFGAVHWHSRHLVVTHHQQTRHYRSYHKIANSYGAQRWQHNRVHRRGVGYRHHSLNTKYASNHARVQARASHEQVIKQQLRQGSMVRQPPDRYSANRSEQKRHSLHSDKISNRHNERKSYVSQSMRQQTQRNSHRQQQKSQDVERKSYRAEQMNQGAVRNSHRQQHKSQGVERKSYRAEQTYQRTERKIRTQTSVDAAKRSNNQRSANVNKRQKNQ